MKLSYRHLLFVVLLGALIVPNASADVRSLWDWAFIVTENGGAPTIINPAPMPSNFDTSNFDFSVADLVTFLSGNTLGSITGTFGPGTYSIVAYLDYDTDGPNNGFNNESGSSGGALAAGETYGMGDPSTFWSSGFAFGRMGTTDSAIDNTPITGQDEAMALGLDFTVLAGDTATVTWKVGAAAPAGAFYLKQSDPGVSDPLLPAVPPSDIFFSVALGGAETPIPEPSSVVLLVTALAAAAAAARKKVSRII